jgi:hypothetical protein
VRIVVLGGGFGGVVMAVHLERRLRAQKDVELTLVSRENFFVITPLLFEACSGRLELRRCAQPIRPKSWVTINVVALGASTNERLIPGSSHAFTFGRRAGAQKSPDRRSLSAILLGRVVYPGRPRLQFTEYAIRFRCSSGHDPAVVARSTRAEGRLAPGRRA